MTKSRFRQTKKRNSLADGIARSVLAGDARAAARVLIMIENRDPLANEVMKHLYSRTGRAGVVGITGSAGSGKSTLIDRMTEELRRRKKAVGILTIDPTSPFTGGALLGDRVRMREHFLDESVFIRSLATRGGHDGLSGCLCAAVQVLDAMGKDYVLIETIGIGQDQIGIAGLADTVLVIVTPESGDDVQGLKAGVLEIADLLVINKADRPGAEELFLNLGNLLGDHGVPTFKTSATKNEGVSALIDGIEKHRAQCVASGNHRQRTLDISRTQVLASVRDQLMVKVQRKLGEREIAHWAQQIADKTVDPYTAAEKILGKMGL